MKVVDYISNNMDAFKGFIKAGIICSSQISYFEIYTFYLTTSKMSSKMERYNFTAEVKGVKVTTVRNAIRVMESPLSKNI